MVDTTSTHSCWLKPLAPDHQRPAAELTELPKPADPSPQELLCNSAAAVHVHRPRMAPARPEDTSNYWCTSSSTNDPLWIHLDERGGMAGDSPRFWSDRRDQGIFLHPVNRGRVRL